MTGRTLAMGDIHGCFGALAAIVEAAKIEADDLLITLGDYVDRGPNSNGVLEWLIRRRGRGLLIALQGNHELMMVKARSDSRHVADWLRNGGDATLRSYSPLDDEGRIDDVPEYHWEFLENHCRSWHETKHHFFVHANAYPDLALDEQPDYMLFWEKFDDPPPHVSGKIMVCGHTPQKSGIPQNLGHAICIDTWAHGGGWLTCLDVESGKYWQTTEQGQSRVGFLDELPIG